MGIALLLCSLLGAGIPGSNDYLSAGEALRQGKYAEASKGFSACAAVEGPLQVYAKAQLAACRAGAGDTKGAADAYEAVLRAFPEGPWVKMVQADLAEIYSRLGDSGKAAECYEAVLSGPVRTWWLQRLEWTASERFAAHPATVPRAYAFFRLALEDPAYRGRRYDAAEMLSRSSDVNDLWLSADALVRFGAVKIAEPVVAALLPQAALTVETRAHWSYLQGRVLLGGGKGDEGRALLLRVAEEYKGSIWAAKSLYQLVRTAKADEVDAALGRLLAEYPGSEEAGDAVWWRAEQFREKEEHTSAIAEYLRLAALFPSHEKTADALLTAGDLLRERQKTGEALEAFQRIVTQYPDAKGRSEAAYWSGRLQEKSVGAAEAVKSYRAASEAGVGDYYAARALARLGKLDKHCTLVASTLDVPGSHLAMGLVKVEPVTVSEPSCEAGSLARLRFFGANGLPEGEWETLYLAEHEASELPTLLTAMADAGLAHTATQLADSFHWGDAHGVVSSARLRIMYPRAYWSEVSLVAREAGVDPYLLLSVARQESTFRASVSSSSGAQGVMQLMPSTAAWLAEKEPGVSPDHAASLNHPSSSLRLGAFYLSRMIESHQGNLALALAAYNAGPGNVRKWRRVHPVSDTEEFVEAIPYLETRNYVKRVLGNWSAYHAIYASPRESAASR